MLKFKRSEWETTRICVYCVRGMEIGDVARSEFMDGDLDLGGLGDSEKGDLERGDVSWLYVL